jgi:prevent-host-death family protein
MRREAQRRASVSLSHFTPGGGRMAFNWGTTLELNLQIISARSFHSCPAPLRLADTSTRAIKFSGARAYANNSASSVMLLAFRTGSLADVVVIPARMLFVGSDAWFHGATDAHGRQRGNVWSIGARSAVSQTLSASPCCASHLPIDCTEFCNQTSKEPTMAFSASDVVPFTQARAKLSELADQAKAGAEKIITKNGESYVALIDADRLDYYHRLERERIHLLLIDDARRGLADIEAGRTYAADAALDQIQRRRAGVIAAGRLTKKRG